MRLISSVSEMFLGAVGDAGPEEPEEVDIEFDSELERELLLLTPTMRLADKRTSQPCPSWAFKSWERGPAGETNFSLHLNTKK